MVILARGYGNHTNRLIQNAHLEAFCREENIPYTNLPLFSMAHHYRLQYNYGEALRFYVLWKTGKYPFVEFNDTGTTDEYKTLLRSHRDNLLFVGGWRFRDFDAMKQQREYLRQQYEPRTTPPSFDLFVQQLQRYDVVLGVHIRRGDYRHWQNGKYFFTNKTYERLINNFILLHPQKSIFVIIFSNEKLSSKDFSLTIDHSFSRFPYYLDHKLMGHCHYLIGPPSTFTVWPSFLYRVPYLHIEQPEQSFQLSDFHCSNG